MMWPTSRRVGFAARLGAMLGVLAAGLLGAPAGVGAAELIKNGGFEATGEDGRSIAGWTSYRWEGGGEVVHTLEAAFAGKRSAIVQGSGPGKIAVIQEVRLEPCSYQLTAMVAGSELIPGTWNMGAQLVVILDDNTQYSHPLVTGDSGWRKAILSFAIPVARKATIYFFNYGSGSLFIDDVSLVPDAVCQKSETAFTLAPRVEAALNWEPPPRPEDRVLEGYCARPDFADRAVCRRLAAKPPASASQVARATSALTLADFEAKTPFHRPSIIPLKKSWSFTRKAITGAYSALLPAAAPLVGEPGTGLMTNWSGYDWLEFDVDNDSGRLASVTIEIRDDKTQDYWSRVNWETTVPPGRSTVHVPLQVFVGEKSVIRERRRLDLAHITRLVILTDEDAPDIVIDNLRLVPEPAIANDFPELIKLDAGPASAPVMGGFAALLPTSRYAARRGYGFSADVRIGRVEDRRHPDDLMRDWISILKGGIDIDLPNGTYHVWMMLEDPGYWDYYPNYRRRVVQAEGRVVADQRLSEQEFLARYFRHADDEDLPGDDIWQRYIPVRYKPLTFDVEVNDGQLNLRFDGGEDPHALPLSALVIFPTTQRERGEAFLAELQGRLKRGYDLETRQVLPPKPQYPKPKANALDGGLSVFQRSVDSDVQATDWPAASELTSALSLSLARGERGVIPVSLFAERDLELTGAELDLPGLEVTATKVRLKVTRANQDGSVYWNVPRVLDPLEISAEKPLALPDQRARSLWFDIHAPPGVAAGSVSGRLRLSFKGGLVHELPVTVTILPWQLPEADIPVGYLGIAPTCPSTVYPAIAQRRVREMGMVVRLLREHGMTAVTGGIGGPRFVGYETGQLRMDFTRANTSINSILAVMKPAEINTYAGLELDGLALDPKTETQDSYKRPYAAVLNDVLAAIKLNGELRGWPPLLHSIGDEPSGDDIDRVAAVGQLFKQSPSKQRTAVFTSFLRAEEPAAKLAGAVDRIYMNAHSEAAIRHILARGSECSLYNQIGRYRRGIYLLKAKSVGCKGQLRFALSSVHADPWYDLDGREMDYAAVFTHPDGRLRIALDFIRMRESVNDYRCLLKLEQSLAGGNATADTVKAKQWLSLLLDDMKVGGGDQAEWTSARIAEVRRTCNEHIGRIVTQSAR